VAVEMITAVANFVRGQGLEVGAPISLRSTNNVVAWMCPSPVVAKIARDLDASTRELQLATMLAAVGAPVVPPIEIGIVQPVNVEGQWATFWHYVADERSATATQVAASLGRLHAGLATVPGRTTFPPCWGRLESAADLLDDPELPGELAATDRSLLRRALLEGVAALASLSDHPHVLHGSPHRFNILVMDDEAVFIDFETVELGPLEWDLAHLDGDVADLYPADLDQDLLQRCRISISAATSMWCWEGIDRGPDMRSHAEDHLEIVRRSLA
jgi:Phosphotransferase enzyme family